LKVLFIARNYPPDVGGAEKLNYDLVKHLAKHVDVEVISNKFGKYSLIFYIYALFKSIKADNVDIIFLSDALLSPLIPLFRIIKRVPIVIKIHGLDITYPNTIYQMVIPFFTRMADKIICISEATKNECIIRGINENKCVIIHVGIDINDMSINIDKKDIIAVAENKLGINLKNRRVILSVGRLVERKGFHWFTEKVVPQLLEYDDNFIYIIAGDGQYRDVIEKIILENNLVDNVKLTGKIDRYTLKILYNIADVFVMPNIRVNGDIEGFGIVILEASSCGVPVVASNVDGIKDAVIDGCNGILVEPHNPESFSKAIYELISNDLLSNNDIRRCVHDNFNWERIISEYIHNFKVLCDK